MGEDTTSREEQARLREYVERLDAYVPSSDAMLRTLDENPAYVAMVVRSLEKETAGHRRGAENGAAGE